MTVLSRRRGVDAVFHGFARPGIVAAALAIAVPAAVTCGSAFAQSGQNSVNVPPGSTIIAVMTGSQANALMGEAIPPFLPDSTAVLYRTPNQQQFVRFYNPAAPVSPSGPLGRYMMRAAEVRGLTPTQIRDRFALPNVPTDMTIVLAPPDTCLLSGVANPVGIWGSGGGQQDVNRGIGCDPSSFINNRLYVNRQALGPDALVYRPAVSGGNATAAAAYLDGLGAPAAYSDLETVYHALDLLNYGDTAPLSTAMQQIGPERYDTLTQIALQSGWLFREALERRGAAVRSGAGAVPTAAVAAPRPPQLALAGGLAEAATALAELARDREMPGTAGAWVQGIGAFGSEASAFERTGFTYRMGGFAAGADVRPAEDVVIGVGAGFSRTSFRWQESGGEGDVNSARLGAYGSYFAGPFFADGALTVGGHWSDAKRRIVFPGIDRTAEGSPNGFEFAARFGAGVDLALEGWEVTPAASVEYVYLSQGGFTETGADSLNLRVRDSEPQALRTQLGGRLARTFLLGDGATLAPEVWFAWVHDIALDDRLFTASLIGQTGFFTVTGNTDSTDGFRTGAGLIYRLPGGIAAFGRYGAEIRRDFTAQAVTGGLRVTF